MAKKLRALIKQYLPHPRRIKDEKSLKIFGKILHNPNLWHLNRYSVSTAFTVGIFVAFIPIPFQMLVAAAFAIIVKANLPISVCLVWITNPLTMPPIFYFCYRIGSIILHRTPKSFKIEFSIDWALQQFHSIGVPLIVGSLICGALFALIANLTIRLIWRYSVIVAWKTRFKRYRTKRNKSEKS